ncbi:polysaccharide biosynthesis protein [Zobellella denitrificans]|uniref:Polysaccharide biosynthesis protein n=1 Tax=Zobellella denitrificans TaxID=347534 RepID=A0A291HRD1_9GAMM|nr:O-antigen translocase [Zobellella denitrificans]ATG74611.1 polysaccharide biosynthesis protein [Zobellella denitrificans]
MTFIKTSFLNGIAVLIRMGCMLALNKVLAIYVGPSGYAVVGQLQNAIQMISTIASGAVTTGVTKYTAEYFDNEEQQKTLWRTAGTIAIVGSLLTSILMVVFSKSLAVFFLEDDTLGYVFIWFSVSLLFLVLNTLLLSVINGKKEVRCYVLSSIVGSILSLLITSLLSFYMGLSGALIGLTVYQSLSFIATAYLVSRLSWFHISNFFGTIDFTIAKKLLKYTAMAITSAICVPLSYIYIRNYIGDSLGWDYAGYWEAANRLSNAYLMFLISTLSVYYIPRISEIKENKEIVSEVKKVLLLVFPTSIILSVSVFIFKEQVVSLLFTKQFMVLNELLPWQLFGDVIKINAWVLACIMLGKNMYKTFIITEVFFSALYCFFITLLVPAYGFKAASMSYALNHILYFILMVFVFVYWLNCNSSKKNGEIKVEVF